MEMDIVKIYADSVGDVRLPENKYIEIELEMNDGKYQTSIIIKENSKCYLVDLKRRVEQILASHLAIGEDEIESMVKFYFESEPVIEPLQPLRYKGVNE